MALNERSLKSLEGVHEDLVKVATRAPYGSVLRYRKLTPTRVCRHCAKSFLAAGKGNKGLCSLECRFWHKVAKRGPNECWMWVGSKSGGYGNFRLGDKTHKAHRALFFLQHGRWPADDLLHTCDVPACVNPSHHREGSHNDNMADMKAKGRARSVHGAANKNAKLTDADVLAIITDCRPVAEIKQQYGIRSSSTIHAIWHGKTWKHIEGPHGC
jgi:hypothetical protein